MNDNHEDLIRRLPEELQSYSVELLRSLAVVSAASPSLVHLILVALPPGSVDVLIETGALAKDRTLTDYGVRVIALVRANLSVIDKIAPPDRAKPLEAEVSIRSWLKNLT
jgi:hypothetical protein